MPPSHNAKNDRTTTTNLSCVRTSPFSLHMENLQSQSDTFATCDLALATCFQPHVVQVARSYLSSRIHFTSLPTHCLDVDCFTSCVTQAAQISVAPPLVFHLLLPDHASCLPCNYLYHFLSHMYFMFRHSCTPCITA